MLLRFALELIATMVSLFVVFSNVAVPVSRYSISVILHVFCRLSRDRGLDPLPSCSLVPPYLKLTLMCPESKLCLLLLFDSCSRIALHFLQRCRHD